MTPTDMPVRSRLARPLASVNGDGGYGVALLVLLACLLLPALAGDSGREIARYDRSGLLAGEDWRLFTAHWVHLDGRHAALNALGLVFAWALFAREERPARWIMVALASMAAIDGGLWFLSREVEWYVGASGWLHGVMAAGALGQLRRREATGWILAVLLAGKLIVEQFTALPFAGGMPVVAQAHLYGALGGLAVAAFRRPRRESL